MTTDKQSGGSDAGSKTSPENAEKPSSLVELLDEWGTKDEPKPAESAKPEDVESRLSALETRSAKDSYKKEMVSVVETLKGDLKIPDLVVEAWINKQADDDARINDLYINRDEKPGRWREAVNALKPEFEKYVKAEFAPPAKDNLDRGVGAAVRASKDSPDSTGLDARDVDVGGLSDSDFALYKAETFRLAKAGKLQ